MSEAEMSPLGKQLSLYPPVVHTMTIQRILVLQIVIFFFQAEDGIRDHCVTGVQTCALPILWLKKCNASPIRVPPDQSCTDLDTSRTASSTSRFFNWRVMRVRRVPNTNVSTFIKIGRASCRERV